MTTLTLAALLHVTLAATGADTYAEAHRLTAETGRPMVVIVGAEWCHACQIMERQILPQAKQQGLLKQVSFATVDLDREQKLGSDLTAGGPIPQLIMYRKTRSGWLRRVLVGSQSVETVASFINEGVQLQAAELQTPAATVAGTAQGQPAAQAAARTTVPPAAATQGSATVRTATTPATQPAAKPAIQPAAKPATGPVVQPAARPASGQSVGTQSATPSHG